MLQRGTKKALLPTAVPVAQLPFKKSNHKKTKAQAFDKAD
jgi:hypothetical protein